MRSRFYIIPIFSLSVMVGQLSFNSHDITTSADGARDVFAIDLDQDGDIDVLSASENDDKVIWYENNGSESFTAHTIATYSFMLAHIGTYWRPAKLSWHSFIL